MRRQPSAFRIAAVARAALACLAFGIVHPALAEDTEHGRLLLKESCSHCHAIDATGSSPLAKAPPFRTLHERYPLEDLEETLAEGIITGHPAMPEMAYEPADIGDIIAYLKSLGGE